MLQPPVTKHVDSVIKDLEKAAVSKGSLEKQLPKVDSLLLKAALLDIRETLEATLEGLGKQTVEKVAHDYKKRWIYTSCGNVVITRAYYPPVAGSTTHKSFPFDVALGLQEGMTPYVKDAVVRCAALTGSFAEAGDLLSRLTPTNLSTSTIRRKALAVGKKIQEDVELLGTDIRKTETEKGSNKLTPVTPTLCIMCDGTGVPCVKSDLKKTKGKAPDGRAKTREIKVGVVFSFSRLDAKSHPVRDKDSASYIAFTGEAKAFGTFLRNEAVRRGYGGFERIQFVGDGAVWISNIARVAFPDAIFTVDYYHAAEHLYSLCKELQLEGKILAKEYQKLKGYLSRYGGESLIRNLKKKYIHAIENSAEAQKEMAYFEKRFESMKYGAFKKQGLYIGSGIVEAACRTIVTARCKQAGMHWCLENAGYMCAIIAAIRSKRIVA